MKVNNLSNFLLWDLPWAQHLLMFSECPVQFLGNVYKRYVDDIFTTFDLHSQLLRFVDYMNRQHPNIKFTFEVLNFLEKTINLTPLLSENLPTFNVVFTIFDSFIPMSYKHGFVNALIFRYFEICSSYGKLKHNEISYLKERNF